MTSNNLIIRDSGFGFIEEHHKKDNPTASSGHLHRNQVHLPAVPTQSQTNDKHAYAHAGALKIHPGTSVYPSSATIPPNVPSQLDPKLQSRKVADIHKNVVHEIDLAYPQVPTEPTRERTFSVVDREEAEARRLAEKQRKLLPDPPPHIINGSTERAKEASTRIPAAQLPETSAAEMTEIFGGLILGLGGQKHTKPAELPQKDYTYRGMIFREGVNLASEFPEGDELTMTPYCVPNTQRIKDMRRPYHDVGVRFSSKEKRGSKDVADDTTDAEEVSDEQDLEDKEGEGTRPNVFIAFGKPPKVGPIDCPPLFATTHQLIMDYIDEHSLEMLLEHLLALCLIKLPDDPYAFMVDHVTKLAEAREDKEKFEQLSRVFYPEHVHAMFRVFDKEQNGTISHKQYLIGMQALGLSRFTLEPPGYRKNEITENTFVKEACHALEILLQSFMA